MQAYEQQARMMKALADPVRLCILDILGREERCVCHLQALLGLRQPCVSRQLAVLGVEATVEKVTVLNQTTAYPILATPGLVIDEQVVSSGRIPSRAGVISWLRGACATAEG